MSESELVVSGRSLPELEAVIERGLTTFVDVGTALLEIREGRLYRETHSTFEDYCRDRWGFSRVQAHRLIEASEVVATLPIGNVTPHNEAQARELARIDDPQQRADVWRTAVDAHGDKVTAADVRHTAQRLAVVDLDSGEINPPKSVIEAAYDVSDEAGKADLNRLQYRAALYRSIKLAGLLFSYDPQDVANALTIEEIDADLDSFADQFRGWVDKIKNRAPRGLHVVKERVS